MSGERHLRDKLQSAVWYERYQGPKPLIVGHRNYLGKRAPLIYRDFVYGLDTDCCYGGALTGLILPSFRILSVQALRQHWSTLRQAYAGKLDWRVGHDRRLSAEPAVEASDDDLSIQSRSPATATGPRSVFVERGEQAVDLLYRYVLAENGRLLAELRRDEGFDSLSPREQGKRYAALIGQTALTELLHMARKGELTRAVLARRFPHPADALSLIDERVLASRSDDVEEL